MPDPIDVKPETALAPVEKKPMRQRLAEQLELAVEDLTDDAAAQLLTGGNLAVLPAKVRTAYYLWRCRQMGLDPLSKPFDIIETTDRSGVKKSVLYANRGAGDQLRLPPGPRRGIGMVDFAPGEPIRIDRTADMLTIWVRGKELETGREEINCASTFIGASGAGDGLARAIDKTMTKAIRRLTMSMTASGMIDETEKDLVQGGRESSALNDV